MTFFSVDLILKVNEQCLTYVFLLYDLTTYLQVLSWTEYLSPLLNLVRVGVVEQVHFDAEVLFSKVAQFAEMKISGLVK